MPTNDKSEKKQKTSCEIKITNENKKKQNKIKKDLRIRHIKIYDNKMGKSIGYLQENVNSNAGFSK